MHNMIFSLEFVLPASVNQFAIISARSWIPLLFVPHSVLMWFSEKETKKRWSKSRRSWFPGFSPEGRLAKGEKVNLSHNVLLSVLYVDPD